MSLCLGLFHWQMLALWTPRFACLFVCGKIVHMRPYRCMRSSIFGFQSGSESVVPFLGSCVMEVTSLAVKVDVIVNVSHFCIYGIHLVGTSQLKSIGGYGHLCR